MIEYSKAKRLKEKMAREEIKEMRDRSKTLADYKKALTVVFHKYIRMRDEKDGCISCGRPFRGKYDAGHFWSQGSYPNLKYHEDNVHGQCPQCNGDKGGNLLEYRPRLIAKIGQERYDALEAARNVRRSYTIPEIQQLIVEYKTKINLHNRKL